MLELFPNNAFLLARLILEEENMGLFNFAKNIGKKVFGGDSPEEDALKKEIADLGLNTDGLDIKVDGDKVTIDGEAVSQEVKEKVILAAGNVDGIASVEDNAKAADNGQAFEFHEVQKGDTLWAVAERYTGNGANYQKIFEANRPMLSDPDKIYPGQMLRIPK